MLTKWRQAPALEPYERLAAAVQTSPALLTVAVLRTAAVVDVVVVLPRVMVEVMAGAVMAVVMTTADTAAPKVE